MPNNNLLQTHNLTKIFGTGEDRVIAVNNVNIKIKNDSIVSIVGQSGSGKTTLARMLLLLIKPSQGNIVYNKKSIIDFKRSSKIKYWQRVQGIFQDPFASFNQFFKVRKILEDCYKLINEKKTKTEKLSEMRSALAEVNLDPTDVLDKFPFELSGGQRQRIMIARAFIIKPKILIADEPSSMIDACSRSNILNALLTLKEERDLTIIFITHDMGLAYYVSDDLFIMKDGKIVEKGDAVKIVESPEHPYTKQLLADVPILTEEWI
ncbi:MAG: ABC transporter ATP-binding protein [Bacillota bacterium]